MSDLTRLLLRDPEIEGFFSAKADMDAMVRFECALALAQAEHEVIEKSTAEKIVEAAKTFVGDQPAIEEATARDGVAAPELVRQLRDHVGSPEADKLHYGATSQDVIDTSLVLRLSQCLGVIENRLHAIVDALDHLIETFGDNSLVGRTRMQKALSITVQDRLVAWKTPLKTHLVRLEDIKPRLLQVQFGGAVGTLDKLGYVGAEVKRALANHLELTHSSANWHNRRDNIIEFASWLSLVSGSIGKIGQDVALMAQNEMGEIKLGGTGKSSAMPHKQNPIRGETLVALARYNAVQVGGMHQSLVHEQERSGAAWTLEWMILPQMVITTGAATTTLRTLLGDVKQIGKI